MPKLYVKPTGPVKLPSTLRHGRAPLDAEMLPDGCYRLSWHEGDRPVYEGSLRVHRTKAKVPDVSGDLYAVDPEKQRNQAGDEIPVHARHNYRYYLQFADVQAVSPPPGRVELAFERVERVAKATSFKERWITGGHFRVTLSPTGDGRTAYVGQVRRVGGGPCAATLVLDRVSPWLRAATIEIDCEKGVPVPVGNGDQFGWASIGTSVGWQFTRLRTVQEILPLSDGRPWKDGECHNAMATWREKDAQLDLEWRYHLLCVGRLDSQDRGVMYDIAASDSDSVVREGAAIAANWQFPSEPRWGRVEAGQPFSAVREAYFRTAVHEIGHAMALKHDTGKCGVEIHDARCCGVMLPTDVLAERKTIPLFPDNIQLAFHEDDQMFLRHAPDPLVRPGGDWPDYRLDEGDQDEATVQSSLHLSVVPLLSKLPLGAPVRVQLRLTQSADASGAIRVPDNLSLSGPHVSGCVTCLESGKVRSFRPLLIRCAGGNLKGLALGEQVEAWLTLLRGGDGALFPEPGDYEIEVRLHWVDAGERRKVAGTTRVTVSKARDAAHERAAKAIVDQPETLLMLVLGGDHLKAGMAAVHAALKVDALRPHYAWIEAKRLVVLRKAPGTRNLRAAARLIGAETVLSEAERRRAQELVVGPIGGLQAWRMERFVPPRESPSRLPQSLNIGLDRVLRFILRVLMQ